MPDDIAVNETGKTNFFVFYIDRSGSMGSQKMQCAIDALVIFIQSLPKGCRFDVVSFGTSHTYLSSEFNSTAGNGIEYNDSNKQTAISKIRCFNSNFGGTNIYNPMQAYNDVDHQNFDWKFFLLSDGSVGNTESVIDLARTQT